MMLLDKLVWSYLAVSFGMIFSPLQARCFQKSSDGQTVFSVETKKQKPALCPFRWINVSERKKTEIAHFATFCKTKVYMSKGPILLLY